MNRFERHLLRRLMMLGAGLTLLVTVASALRWLEPLERWFHDLRARRCQVFSPAPSDQVAHLDIDDETIRELGRWPFSREVQARLLREVARARPAVVAIDVLYSEPEPPRLAREGEALVERDPDGDLAEALRQLNGPTLAMSVAFESPGAEHRALLDAMRQALGDDLELDRAAVYERVRSDFSLAKLAQRVRDLYPQAAREAAFHRIHAALAREPGLSSEQLHERLAPRAFARNETTDTRLAITRVEPVARAAAHILARGRPAEEVPVDILRAAEEISIPLLRLLETGAGVAFVDFLPASDGVVRSVPLLIDYRGAVVPQFALAAACATLGVDPASIEARDDHLLLPRGDAPPLRIPVRAVRSRAFGHVGLFLDVPWFGPAQWERMYATKAEPERTQHVSLRSVYAVCQLEDDIGRNNRQVDEAMADLASLFGNAAAARLLEQRPAPLEVEPRAEAIAGAVAELREQGIEAMLETPPEQWTPEVRLAVGAYRALPRIAEHNRFLAQRLHNERARLARQLTGKTVLLGLTATGALDVVTTSLHARCPGVVVHGVVLNGILTGHLWRPAPGWFGPFTTIAVGLLATLTVARLPPVRAMLAAALLVIGHLLVNGYVLFDWLDRVAPAAAPVAAAALVWSSLTLTRFVIEKRERTRITARFRNYVDPVLVNYVIEHPSEARLEGQVREMTVAFTDLAGFTTLSEKLRERTVTMLNEYMGLMVPLIRRNNGYWDKFLGDGVMFFFNAPLPNPRHASDAVRTVLEMQKATEQFNHALFARGLPRVAMRAGVSTGEMVVGDAGSTDPQHIASNYTVLGDAVNLGSRLESANKAIGTRALLSQRTVELLDNEYLLRPVGSLRVVGKALGVMCYEPLALLAEAGDDQKALADLSRVMVEAYLGAEFAACVEAAERLEQRFGSTRLTQLYLSLARAALRQPPADFDGQIILTEK